MKNVKNFSNFISIEVNEWLDAPGSVDVPSDSYENKVRSRNYHSTDPTMPQVYDAMFEASEIYDFLDEHGKSEDFNKFLEKKRSGKEITDHIKEYIKERKNKAR